MGRVRGCAAGYVALGVVAVLLLVGGEAREEPKGGYLRKKTHATKSGSGGKHFEKVLRAHPSHIARHLPRRLVTHNKRGRLVPITTSPKKLGQLLRDPTAGNVKRKPARRAPGDRGTLLAAGAPPARRRTAAGAAVPERGRTEDRMHLQHRPQAA